MFRLVVLSAVLAVAAAAPGLIHSAPVAYTSVVHQPALVAQKEISYQKSIIEEPTVVHAGTVLKNIPTGITHHSSSVVHHDAKISEPIFAPAVKKTIVETPVEKTVLHKTYAAAPVVTYAAAPAVTYAAAPIAKAAYVEAAPVAYAHAAPVAHYGYAAAPALSYAASYPSIYSHQPAAVYAKY
ncbi:cuticle protein 16.5-like [Uranotaenia lowii]|uniref:cuticle protein 16.5-like n=1 Tax=Uranotaenia lowii TaxID=190385 RepID=UPI00247A9E35|nr:cuticle protein 16.5-like [Uranotaenia lowii]